MEVRSELFAATLREWTRPNSRMHRIIKVQLHIILNEIKNFTVKKFVTRLYNQKYNQLDIDQIDHYF